MMAYAQAVTNPFSPLAVGARVPDLYSYPSSTFKTEGTFQVKTDGTGIMSFALTGIPWMMALNTSAGISPFQGSILESVNANGNTISCQPYDAVSLQTKCGTYRVVGAGYMITSMLTPTATTGRVMMAAVPISGHNPGPKIMSSGTAASYATNSNDIICTMTGMTGNVHSTAHLPSTMLELPNSVEFPLAAIIGDAVQVTHNICSPHAFEYHTSNVNQNYGRNAANTADLVDNNGESIPGLTVIYEDSTQLDHSGKDMIWVRVEGAPANTVVLDVKYIFHFEGTPYLPSGVVPADRFTSSAASAPPVDPIGHLKFLSEISNHPAIRFLGRAAFNGLAAAGRRHYGHSTSAVGLIQGMAGMGI